MPNRNTVLTPRSRVLALAAVYAGWALGLCFHFFAKLRYARLDDLPNTPPLDFFTDNDVRAFTPWPSLLSIEALKNLPGDLPQRRFISGKAIIGA